MSETKLFERGSTKGFLHLPLDPTSNNGIVLTHGAGGNCRSALLIAVANQLAAAGVWVLRYDLPFRQVRPFGPPVGKSENDREGLFKAGQELRTLGPTSIYLGGHSYGGRQASILAVEEPSSCDGLLLLSYPLHPPKEPRKLRTEHFGRLSAAALFVHGTRDPFGSEDELHAALELIWSATAITMVSGAGHDLLKGDFGIREQVVMPFCNLMSIEVEPNQHT